MFFIYAKLNNLKFAINVYEALGSGRFFCKANFECCQSNI